MSEPQEPIASAETIAPKGWLKRVCTIRDAPSYVEGLAFGAGCIAFVLLIWWGLTIQGHRIVDAYTLSTPYDTFATFPELWKRELSRSVLISLVRVMGGFALAAAIGVPLGIVAGSYLRVNAFFKPLVLFGRSIPIAALIPLTLVWFGLNEASKVMFIFLATIAFVIFDTVNTVHAVPDRFIDTAYTLGARGSLKKGARIASFAGIIYALLFIMGWHFLREYPEPTLMAEFSRTTTWILAGAGFLIGFVLWFPITGHQVLRKVILPLALPDVVNSLRLIFGLAFGYIMLAEVINAKSGIGALINMSQRQGPREHIYLCLFIISLLAWAIDRSIMLLQRQLFPHIQHGEN